MNPLNKSQSASNLLKQRKGTNVNPSSNTSSSGRQQRSSSLEQDDQNRSQNLSESDAKSDGDSAAAQSDVQQNASARASGTTSRNSQRSRSQSQDFSQSHQVLRPGKKKQRGSKKTEPQMMPNLQSQDNDDSVTTGSVEANDEEKTDNATGVDRTVERAGDISNKEYNRRDKLLFSAEVEAIRSLIPGNAHFAVLYSYLLDSNSIQAQEAVDALEKIVQSSQNPAQRAKACEAMLNEKIDFGAATMFILKDPEHEMWEILNDSERRVLEAALSPNNVLAKLYRERLFSDDLYTKILIEFDDNSGLSSEQRKGALMDRLFNQLYKMEAYPYAVKSYVEQQSLGNPPDVLWNYSNGTEENYHGYADEDLPIPSIVTNITVKGQPIRVVRKKHTGPDAENLNSSEFLNASYLSPKRLQAVLERLPEASLRSINEIVFNPNKDPEVKDTVYSANAIGQVHVYPLYETYTDFTGKKLLLNIPDSFGGVARTLKEHPANNDHNLIVTFIHESGHALTESPDMWGTEDSERKAGWDNWRAAMKSDRISPSRYASYNPTDDGMEFLPGAADGHEDLAETYALYAVTKGNKELHESYRTMFPARFEILDRLFVEDGGRGRSNTWHGDVGRRQ